MKSGIERNRIKLEIAEKSLNHLEKYKMIFNQIKNKVVRKLKRNEFSLTVARAIISTKYLGPWRKYIIKLIISRSSNPKLPTHSETIFPDVNVKKFIEGIRKKGYHMGINLPKMYVNNILTYFFKKEDNSLNVDPEKCEWIHKIVYDPKVVEVVRGYLGTEPLFYKAHIYKRHDKMSKPRAFHYDLGDYKSLSLFFYLTDVDEDSSPHSYIEGTHNEFDIRKRVFRFLSHDRAKNRFRGRIKIFTGDKGTGFFEDLLGYHKRSFGCKCRIILSISYTLRRRSE